MKKLFHFDSPRERYICDAAVVACFDHRFKLAFDKFLKKQGIEVIDPIRIAGGAKSLVSPELETDRAFVLEQIRKSIRLHGTKLVIIKVHSDCGAYGGLEAFGGDTKRESEHHEQELLRATEFLAREIPDAEVRGYFVDFEGVWAMDPAGVLQPA
jgi:carbonic anhydrase